MGFRKEVMKIVKYIALTILLVTAYIIGYLQSHYNIYGLHIIHQ